MHSLIRERLMKCCKQLTQKDEGMRGNEKGKQGGNQVQRDRMRQDKEGSEEESVKEVVLDIISLDGNEEDKQEEAHTLENEVARQSQIRKQPIYEDVYEQSLGEPSQINLQSQLSEIGVDKPIEEAPSLETKPCQLISEPVKKKRGRPRKFLPEAYIHQPKQKRKRFIQETTHKNNKYQAELSPQKQPKGRSPSKQAQLNYIPAKQEQPSTAFASLAELPPKQQSDYTEYSNFLRRRAFQPGQPMDLGVMTLSEVVEHSHSKGLLTREIYFQFVNNFKQDSMVSFIQAYLNRRLRAWDFGHNKITIADHRRLSQLLDRLCPGEYVLRKPQALDKKIDSFLLNMYLLSGIEYSMIINEIDKISRISWWKPLAIKYVKLVNQILLVPEDKSLKTQRQMHQIQQTVETQESKRVRPSNSSTIAYPLKKGISKIKVESEESLSSEMVNLSVKGHVKKWSKKNDQAYSPPKTYKRTYQELIEDSDPSQVEEIRLRNGRGRGRGKGISQGRGRGKVRGVSSKSK